MGCQAKWENFQQKCARLKIHCNKNGRRENLVKKLADGKNYPYIIGKRDNSTLQT
jgi:hypothetical protein